MATTGSPCLRIKDYRGLTQLKPEQEQQLAAAKAAAVAATAAAEALTAAAAAAESGHAQAQQQLRAPAAKLNSGYEIPLVGLGTW
jgi:hypothetical protein